MKTRLLLTSLSVMLLGLAQNALADTIPVSSKTQRVTAYQGLALVTRRVELPSLSTGSHEIVIGDLPEDLNDDSLSVSGEGQARLKIHHLQLRPVPEGSLDPALVALQKQVKDLQQQLSRVNSQAELIDMHEALLETFQTELEARAENPERRLSVSEWQGLMDFALEESEEILDRRQTTASKKQTLEEQLAKLSIRLQELTQSSRPRQQASLFITVENPGKATLMLSYLIGNVRWQPAYEARLDDSLQKLKLVYLGDLTQRSGESWENVQLTLSTVTPVLNQRPPVATAWQVGPRPVPVETRTGALQRNNNEFERADMPAAPSRDVNYAQSEIQTTGISVRFQLPENQNIPSSTETRRLAMATREFSVATSYRLIPRQSPLAFLEVQLKNESGLPLLPGPMRSYLGDEFTGSQPIDLIRPGQVARLNFGVDQDIKVSWKEVSRDKRSSGVLGDKDEWTVVYEAEVTNFKPIAVELRIQEPAPVVTDERIDIIQLSADPAPTQVTDDKKLQTWQIKAQPWEKKTIKLSYRITVPKGMELYF